MALVAPPPGGKPRAHGEVLTQTRGVFRGPVSLV